jgi:Ca-activated chloride channel family protein
MRADVKLSTKFLSTQNAHQVGLLIGIEGEVPARRAPINLALVLDRSGSMAGPKLAAAREAAARFVRFLSEQDRLAVVAFDDQVVTVYGPSPARPEAAEAIARIPSGGSTNLSGGWLAGRSHVGDALLADGVNRVVLFTDGMANVGIVDHGSLVGMARDAASQRVTTTCIGFGADFHEDLLRDMAQAGGANYWFIENEDQMASVFAEEIEGLVALAAQNLEIEVRLTHPGVAGVSLLQAYPVTHTDDGTWRVRVGDLYATSPRNLGLVFHVENVAALGHTELGQVTVRADVVLAEGVEHRKITMPVRANLDGADHVEPVVERTFLRYEAARAREEAMRLADAGDLDAAAERLQVCALTLQPFRDDAVLREEAEDLVAEAGKLAERQYSAMDRKYHQKRMHSASRDELAYLKKIARHRGPRTPDDPC